MAKFTFEYLKWSFSYSIDKIIDFWQQLSHLFYFNWIIAVSNNHMVLAYIIMTTGNIEIKKTSSLYMFFQCQKVTWTTFGGITLYWIVKIKSDLKS